jgi:hypothetical protein
MLSFGKCNRLLLLRLTASQLERELGRGEPHALVVHGGQKAEFLRGLH